MTIVASTAIATLRLTFSGWWYEWFAWSVVTSAEATVPVAANTITIALWCCGGGVYCGRSSSSGTTCVDGNWLAAVGTLAVATSCNCGCLVGAVAVLLELCRYAVLGPAVLRSVAVAALTQILLWLLLMLSLVLLLLFFFSCSCVYF